MPQTDGVQKDRWKNEVICRASMVLGCTYSLQVCMDFNKKQKQ